LTAAEKEEKRRAIKTLFVYVFVKLHRFFETIKKTSSSPLLILLFFLKLNILPFSFFNERFSIESHGERIFNEKVLV
jgi:hypothetical protein